MVQLKNGESRVTTGEEGEDVSQFSVVSALTPQSAAE